MPEKTFSVQFETSGFRRASRRMSKVGDEADDTGSSLKSAGKVGGAAIAGLATAIGTAVTATGALVAKSAEYARQVEQAAAQSGIAAEKIQEIAFAAKQTSGASFDTVRDGLKELAIRSEEAANGTGEAKEAFDELGISQQFLEDASTAEIFRRVRQELQGASARMRTFAAETIFGGEAGEQLVQTMQLSTEEMQRLSKQARASGNVLSGEQVQALERTRQSWTRLTSSLMGFGRQIAADLAPVINGTLIPALRSMGRFVRDSISAVMSGGSGAFSSFMSGARRAASVVTRIWSTFRADLAQIWQSWGGFIVESAETAWQNLSSLFTGAAGVLTGIWETLVGVLTGNWAEAWTGIKRVVQTAALTVAQAVVGLVESVLNTLSQLSSYIPGVGDTISGALDSARQSVEGFRDSIRAANREAAGLASTWGGFGGGDFGGGGVSASFNQQSGPAAPSGGASGGGAGREAQGMEALMHWTNQAGKAMRSMREQTKKTKEEGRQTTNVLQRGFRSVFTGIGRMTAGLITGQSRIRSFGEVASRALSQVISKLTTLTAKAAAVSIGKGIFGTALGLSTGGIGSLLGGVLGFASGGIVTGPTLGVIGEGTESEAVMPLSKLNEFVSQPRGGGTIRGRGDRISQGMIEIPVELVDQAQRRGSKNLSRTGR